MVPHEHLVIGVSVADRDDAIELAGASGAAWFKTTVDKLDVQLDRVTPHADGKTGAILSYSVDAVVTLKDGATFPKPRGAITPKPDEVPA